MENIITYSRLCLVDAKPDVIPDSPSETHSRPIPDDFLLQKNLESTRKTGLEWVGCIPDELSGINESGTEAGTVRIKLKEDVRHQALPDNATCGSSLG